ncbi:MAG TPA: SpoIVB peptidase S55 domain-containing protein [Actinomycetota bacterium]|nr:SpoIVB peptidase S55 domain-containing protein [Actinomycetota bacterium]
MGATRPGRPRLVALAVGVLLIGSAFSAPATTAAALCSSEPDVFPVADLEAGMTATAWTVVEGTEPVSFDVEILGVIPDGIAAGVDFVLIHTSGPVIDQTGGIAFGFSGSPVYIGTDLVGSVSYGFGAADQTFGGVTPAEDMLRLLSYPSGTDSLGVAGAIRAPSFATRVRMPASVRASAAETLGTSVEQVPTVAEPLKLPLGVSGLNDRAMRKFKRTLKLGGLPVVPYRAGAAGATELAAQPLEPGDAVGGALSVGDLSAAGVGTVTAVCDDLVLAFGHPFNFDGAPGTHPMAMYGAEVLAVIPDPSNLVGPFKIANLTELHGIVDQDRLLGIRGVEGVEPTGVPVTSVVSNPDLATIRDGETTIFRQELGGFPVLPDIAAFHLLANEDVVFDRIGDGSVTLRFVIEGIGPDGAPFRLVRPNIWFSDFDASFESIFELYGFLFQIQDNAFGPVVFTGVDIEASITQQELTSEIVKVRSASSLQPGLRERDRLRVRSGDTIRLEISLLDEGALEPDVVELLVPVPRVRFGGALAIAGGAGDDCLFCFFDEANGEEEGPATFADLLRELRRTPRNNDLVASLRVGRGEPRTTTFRADAVILGSDVIEIVVDR